MVLGIVALQAPFALYGVLTGGEVETAWGIVGGVGAFIVGIGLFNIVAAALKQYLGHFVTLGCFLLGGLLMAAGVLWG